MNSHPGPLLSAINTCIDNLEPYYYYYYKAAVHCEVYVNMVYKL